MLSSSLEALVEEMTDVLTSVQLVTVSGPLHAQLWHVIQSDQVEVSWDSMDGLTPQLLETGEEVLSNIDWLLQLASANICWCIRHNGGVVVRSKWL